MTSRTTTIDRVAIVVWAAVVAIALVVVVRARFTADLSAFLPTRPTPEQALLIEQLREGPASHLLLVAIDGDGAGIADATLARLSRATAATLRRDARFLSVNNGETLAAARDRTLFLEHRYLLGDRVAAARFTATGLHAALVESLDLLGSSAGLALQPLLTRDPTGELLHLVDRLTAGRALPVVDGTWLVRSSDQGPHALLVVETRADGSDIDGQQVAITALRQAFAAARTESGDAASRARLVVSGPAVFAVDARDTIEREATRLSIVGAVAVAALLGFVYRSPRVLLLGLLPMASGALCGLAAIAIGFGVVHGIALGFGVTLIGEAVDYAIYLFVQGSRAARPGMRGFWSTIALGVATSAIGFGALLFSGFAGLAQIGLLSITGLVVAALATRWVVPAWLPDGFVVRPMPRVGAALASLASAAFRMRWPFAIVAVASVVVLALHRDALWSRDLASLSPVPKAALDADLRLRSELGAPDVGTVVVVRASDEQRALEGSERIVDALGPAIAEGLLVGLDAPSDYLPSPARQRARRDALPDDASLRRDFARALDGLPFRKTGFDGFFADVAREKAGALVTSADLEGTSIAAALRALLSTRRSAGDAADPLPVTAVVALRGLRDDDAARRRVAAAIEGLSRDVDGKAIEVRLIDIGVETRGLYADYLSRALKTAAVGAAAIVVLLAVALRDVLRLARVVLPLVIAVLTIGAAHVAIGGPLTLFHFVGLLLIVAVGSNYTLFFDRREDGDRRLLVSLVVANATAVIGFGVLGLSSLPVLHAIGTTVAPGALLALIGAAVFASRPSTDPRLTSGDACGAERRAERDVA